MASAVCFLSRHCMKGQHLWFVSKHFNTTVVRHNFSAFTCSSLKLHQFKILLTAKFASSAQCRPLSTTASVTSRTPPQPSNDLNNNFKVKLTDQEGVDLGSVTIAEAHDLARKKELKVVVIDSGTKPLPTYRIMSTKQITAEKLKQKQEKGELKAKTSKTVQIGSKISPHDLGIKLKNVQEWLGKGHKVNVLIKNVDKNNKGINDVFHSMVEATSEVAVIENAKSTQRDIFFILKPKSLLQSGKTTKLKPMTMEELKKLRKTQGDSPDS